MLVTQREIELYLESDVSVLESGTWISVFEFCAKRHAEVNVITAWNPGNERPEAEINELRNEQLRAGISALGFEPIEALGSDRNSTHSEKSWAVIGMTDDVAIELGKKYQQVAVFFITRARQWVLGSHCRSEHIMGDVVARRDFAQRGA